MTIILNDEQVTKSKNITNKIIIDLMSIQTFSELINGEHNIEYVNEIKTRVDRINKYITGK